MEIVFTTDFHAQFLRAPGLIPTLNAARARGALVVDSGDFLGESYATHALGNAALVDLQNESFDALCPGNHGFHEALASPRLVCCNLTRDGQALTAWRIFERQALRVGVIGAIGAQAFHAIRPDQRREYAFEDERMAVTRAISQVRAAGANRIILLSHSGFDQDLLLAADVAGIDVILAGHCHSDLVARWVGSTLVVKAPDQGRGLGRMHFGEQGARDLNITFSVPDVGPEPALLAPLADLAMRPLGVLRPAFAACYLKREIFVQKLLDGLAARYPRRRVIVNLNMFRGAPPCDAVSERALYEFCPFDNQLVSFRWDGNDVFKLLERNDVEPFGEGFHPSVAPNQRDIITTDYIAMTYLGLDPEDFIKVGHCRDLVATVILKHDQNDCEAN